MTPEEKIAFVKKMIIDKAAISPSGLFSLDLLQIIDTEATGGIPDEAPVILFRKEQWSIIKKLEEENFVINVQLDEEKEWRVWLEIPKKATRVSNLLSHIKTTDELLQRRELFEKFLQIIDVRSIKPGHKYILPTEEKNDDLIQLLIDLDLIEYDWNKLKKQKHREVGNRLIEFGFSADKVLELYGRISGKDGIIKREAMELISKDIGGRFTINKIIQLFGNLGVPESMFVDGLRWKAVFYILSFYATAKNKKDNLVALKIIQEFIHPLLFGGDDEKAEKTRKKYKQLLKYDNIDIDENGKVYLCPTEEEFKIGIEDMLDTEGKAVEAKGYLVYPDHVARLWVLWSQLTILVSAYENNQTLDHKALEKLYLEIIGQVEELIRLGKVGRIQEFYKRPFTSLATAHIETKVKKTFAPLELINLFLVVITGEEPNPSEVAKEMKKQSLLIKRVAKITKAINGSKINFLELSYEQALFVLKVIIARTFGVLEAASTGYIGFADEQLNTKYILLLDNMNGLLARPDLQKIKEWLPELPSHLFSFEEMDMSWEFFQPEMMNFIGEVEAAWVRAGQQTFPLPGWLVQHLINADEISVQHKKSKAIKWNKMLSKVDAEKIQEKSPVVSSPADEQRSGTQKIINALDEAIVRGLQHMNFAQPVPSPVQKIEITAMPELRVKNVEDTILAKGKKNIHLPKFKPTDWVNVTIRFLNERNVLITADKKEHIPADFETLGFADDKRGKPNLAWNFLYGLAKNNGETQPLPTPIPDTVKQQKRQLSDRLKTIFKNDTDPFHDPTETRVYRIKINLIPPQQQEEVDDLGIHEYLDETATQVYEDDPVISP